MSDGDDDLPLPPIRKRKEKALFNKGGPTIEVSQRPKASDVDDDDFPLPPTRKMKEGLLSNKGGPTISFSAAKGSGFQDPTACCKHHFTIIYGVTF
jgi:hypothetical protein